MSKQTNYQFTSKVFLWSGDKAAWHFIGLPKNMAEEIKHTFATNRRGFRSIPITITIGATTWSTSMFPDKHSGSYLIPLKQKVRAAEAVFADEEVACSITIKS